MNLDTLPLEARDINEFPRLSRIATLAERAIDAAVQEVEKAGADIRLTRAVILLRQAREWVADYVDGVTRDEDGNPREDHHAEH